MKVKVDSSVPNRPSPAWRAQNVKILRQHWWVWRIVPVLLQPGCYCHPYVSSFLSEILRLKIIAVICEHGELNIIMRNKKCAAMKLRLNLKYTIIKKLLSSFSFEEAYMMQLYYDMVTVSSTMQAALWGCSQTQWCFVLNGQHANMVTIRDVND